MSKFFQDDDDDYDEEQEEKGEINQQKPDLDKQNRDKILNELLSSDDDDKNRTIVTEKEKRYNKLREIIKEIKIKMKNHDFVQLLDKYEKLNKEIEKGAKFFETEGGIPRLYIRCLCQIEELQLKIPNEEKKKWGVNNNKAFNTLKQRLKKNNLNYQESINTFLENPVDTDQSADEEKKLRRQNRGDKDEGIKIQKEESEEESDEDDKYLLQSSDPMVRRRYWLKKKKPDTKKPEQNEDEQEKKKPVQRQEEEIDYDIKFNMAQNQEIEVDFGPEAVVKQLEKIVASRGVKNQTKNIIICEKMIQHFIKENLKKTVEILLILINLQFDQAKSEQPGFITRQSWLQIYQNVQLIYSLYKEKGVKVDSILTYSKSDSEMKFGETYFLKCILLMFQTLENELNKSFQVIDYYTQEYAERVSDQYQLMHLSQKLLEVFEQKNDQENIIKICFKQLEGIYYIPPQVIQKLLEIQQTNKQSATPLQIFGNMDISQKIEELALKVFKSDEKELQIKANLYWIYNLALNGKYEQAYETFISTVSFEQIQSSKTIYQLHYNRALVQLGFAAFRQGLINEAHMHLADLMSRDKVLKDLLAQNYSKSQEGEIRYNIPYHMSINMETIEFVYLLSAMLLEVPNIHADPFDEGHKIISRKFRQLCQYYNQLQFNPQAENMRDIIYIASKELGKGDWKQCWEQLKQIPLWTRVYNYEQVQLQIKQKVQEQSLKCYIFSNKNAFANVSLDFLQQRFNLPLNIVKQIIYKMIYHSEIKAKFQDEESNYLIFITDDQQYSQAKRLAGQMLEKLSNLNRLNEKLLDKIQYNITNARSNYQNQQQENDGQDQNKQTKKKTTSKQRKPNQKKK